MCSFIANQLMCASFSGLAIINRVDKGIRTKYGLSPVPEPFQSHWEEELMDVDKVMRAGNCELSDKAALKLGRLLQSLRQDKTPKPRHCSITACCLVIVGVFVALVSLSMPNIIPFNWVA